MASRAKPALAKPVPKTAPRIATKIAGAKRTGKATPLKRAIGRPAAGGNGVGRELLLKTACDLLKTTPPAKLTRFLVAQQANVDPSLIRYYFKDRLSLLAAAAERLSDQHAQRSAAAAGPAPATALGQLTARLTLDLGLDATYAHFRRLLMDELLASDEPQARGAAVKIAARAAQAYRQMAKEGLADGSVREEDGVMLFVAVMALSSYFPSARLLYEAGTGKKIGQKAMTEKYTEFVAGLIARGMAPDPTKRKTGR